MDKNTAFIHDHLDIYDIKEDMVILKTGGASAVIEAGAINFDLLSQREQDAAILAYSGLLNSLTFPIQVVIRSRIMNISDYIKKIQKAEIKIEGELLRQAAQNYRKYVESIVQNYSILDKKFFVAVSYNKSVTLPTNSAFGWIKDLFGLTHKDQGKINVGEVINKAKPELDPRVEHVIREFKRINIPAKRLSSEELIRLYYEIYNPDSNMGTQVQSGMEDYTTEMVETLWS